MSFDVEMMELLEKLRKKLDLVEAYWYFVEHGADAHDCGLARQTLAKFQGSTAPEVRKLIAEIHKRLWGIDGRDRS
jgi:hypothetical protein